MKFTKAFLIVFLLVSIPAAFIAGETVNLEYLARHHMIAVPEIPTQIFHTQKGEGVNHETKNIAV